MLIIHHRWTLVVGERERAEGRLNVKSQDSVWYEWESRVSFTSLHLFITIFCWSRHSACNCKHFFLLLLVRTNSWLFTSVNWTPCICKSRAFERTDVNDGNNSGFNIFAYSKHSSSTKSMIQNKFDKQKDFDFFCHRQREKKAFSAISNRIEIYGMTRDGKWLRFFP